MNRRFNITGPCNPKDHYMVSPFRHLWDEINSLISVGEYFVIHAARQTGKTTLLMELDSAIHSAGRYYGLYCSLEGLEGIKNAAEGIPAIIKSVNSAIGDFGLPNAGSFMEGIDLSDYTNALRRSLSLYCRGLDKPLVPLFDEVDCLSGQTLISFLRQLRNGFVTRSKIPFPHSVALVGMRNIRDYRDEYRSPKETLGDASPYNIAKAYMTMNNFTLDEVSELYAQRTRETGQAFEGAAVELAWRQTQGQPWLVNAIACEIVEKITGSKTVTPEMVSQAIHSIETKRAPHIDSLMARLREERVRRVIEPVIIGKEGVINRFSDDYGYAKDLGLIRDDNGTVEPANPIYADIMVRTLNADTQYELAAAGPQYQLPRYMAGGVMDMDCLLMDFQAFWRENSGIWTERYEYKEAAPQLILQAFLQRVLNGGGRITREMAAATGRADLCVEYNEKRYPMEMKIRRTDKAYEDGVKQILGYMDILGCDKGWLVVFDNRKNTSWDERIFNRRVISDGKTVMIYGC